MTCCPAAIVAPVHRGIRDWSSAIVAPPPSRPIVQAATRPTFAVVIAAYQAADTIADALDSVLAQTLQANEIIVCDDGSTDETEAVLDRYREHVAVIRQPNRGVAAARNAAVRAASSDFIAILDADDSFMPQRIEAIAALAVARPDLDMIMTDAVAEVDGQPVGHQSDIHPFPADAEAQRAEVLRHSYLAWPAIRRRRMLAVGGYDETLRIGEDWHCWIKLILDGSLAGCINEPLYRYRLTLGSLASDPAANHRANVDVLERIRGDRRLKPAERDIVVRGIASHRRAAALIDAREAILIGRPDARTASLNIAVGRGFTLQSRAKACASALAPRVARRLLERQLTDAPAPGLDVGHR